MAIEATTIWVPVSLLTRLDAIKRQPKEAYHRVISRLLREEEERQ